MGVRGLRRVLLVVVVAAAGMGEARAGSPAPSAGSLVAVSGPREPAVPGCDAGELDGFEGDHTIAVHPTDPEELVAVYAQDGELSLGVARSHDGGRSWTPATAPGFVHCDGSGDPFGFAFDGWATTGPDGRTYVSAAVATPSLIPPDPEGGYGVVVATTSDGGRTWDGSVVVARSIDLLPTDKPTVTADPLVPGRAWLTWTEVSIVGGTSITRVARTDDGGRTWSAPSLHLPAAPVFAEFGNEIVVLPDGDLVRVFSRFSAQPLVLATVWVGGTHTIVAARSSDGGRTWTEREVAPVPESVLRDPETGEDLALGIPFVVADVASDGHSVGVAWAEPTAAGRVRLARSPDGGRTWTVETVARSTTPTFRAALAMGRGRISVAYSDLGADVPGDEQLSTRTILATWRDRRGWSHRAVGPIHDLRDARQAGASAIPGGDYWGIAHVGRATVVGMNLPAPPAASEPGDLFAWRGRPNG